MVNYARPGVFVTENFFPLTTGGPGIPGEALPAVCAIFPRGPAKPTLIQSWAQFLQLYGGFSVDPGNLLPFAVYQFFNNGGSKLFVLSLPNTDATNASLLLEDVGTPEPSDILTVTAQNPGVWGEQIYIEIISAGTTGRVDLNVYLNGVASSNLVETFQDMSMNPIDPNGRYLVTMVNSPVTGSNFVTVANTTSGGYTAGVTDLALVSPTPLTGGSDGSTPPNITTAAPAGFDTLINQALYINIPGYDNITGMVTLEAWAHGRGDTMFIIDGPSPGNEPELESQVATDYINLTQGSNSLPQSTYLTVYAPWLLVNDPSSSVPGATLYLPPGGAVLAMWEQADTVSGTVQSPAGITFTLRIVDLEVRFSNASLDALNLAYVNAIKYIPGIGFCVFGARTLHPAYPDRYIAVRRMIIKLEHDFKWITQYALFQPNDAVLWKSISVTIQNYLLELLQANQLGGDTPSDSYSVVCDSTINTPATAAAGIVNCNVAVSLLSPAEYIEIVLSQFQASGAQASTVSSGVSS